ncbi:MAG: ABC transporter permease [Haloarculaceae archaeon]
MSTTTSGFERIKEIFSEHRRQRYRSFLRRLRSNPKALVGLAIVGALLLVALFAPYIAPYSPTEIHVMKRTQAPSLVHPFGTDNFGRDVFSRVIMGSRISLFVGFTSVAIATVFGVPIGIIGGYYGGWTDETLMRLMDAMMSFPPVLLALVVVTALGSSLTNVLLALGFVYTPFFARVSRSATLSTVNDEYVEAAEARGEGDFYILFREILPNTMAPVLVQASISVAFAILAAAALSFLGLGTQPPTPSWGLMINNARGYLDSAPWMAIFPGLAIGVTVLGFNMLGDALRDVLDPKVDTVGRSEE